MDTQLLTFAMILVLMRRRRVRLIGRNRRYWVHPIHKARNQIGEFFTLIPLLEKDEEKFIDYFRVNFNQFNILLNKVKPNSFGAEYYSICRHVISKIILGRLKFVISMRNNKGIWGGGVNNFF